MEDRSYFFSNIDFKETPKIKELHKNVEKWAEENQMITYLLKKPLSEEVYNYDYKEGVILLVPEHNVIFINLNSISKEEFEIYIDDVIDDINYLSMRYEYIKRLGRPRKWKDEFFSKYDVEAVLDKSIDKILKENEKIEYREKRNADLLISLITENINDIKKIGMEDPSTRLEKIKKNIILFDGKQTNFIHEEKSQKITRIQGLAGTGKTELLLHKLRKLYIEDDNTKIVFTCHNRVLEDTLKKRTPKFFDFMKVDEQIKWDERLWVMRSWGSRMDKNSGVYSYICNYYNIPFRQFTYGISFNEVCTEALEYLQKINTEDFNPCFDYILIDESQDFGEVFFELCKKVTSKKIYIAGDIFQNVFDMNIIQEVTPDYILNKCYRTDSRTLMFAHALGMGLFRDLPLRWLNDDEWTACGYNIDKEIDFNKKNYVLTRNLVRRFEDNEIGKESMCLVIPDEYTAKSFIDKIIQSIDEILDEFPDAKPEDIGIIFEQNENNMKLSKHLGIRIMEKYNWQINFAYDNKEKRDNTLFISNNNHVKGLEFPFVICFTTIDLDDNIKRRNIFYMMLTRSFIKSFLLIPGRNTKEVKKLESGLDIINSHRKLIFEELDPEQQKEINDRIINLDQTGKTFDDVLTSVFKEFKYSEKEKQILAKAIFKNFENAYLGKEERIKRFIKENKDIFLKDNIDEDI